MKTVWNLPSNQTTLGIRKALMAILDMGSEKEIKKASRFESQLGRKNKIHGSC